MKKIIIIGIILLSIISCKKEDPVPEPEYGTLKYYNKYKAESIEVVSKTDNTSYVFTVTEQSDIPEKPYMYVCKNILVGIYALWVNANGRRSYRADIGITKDAVYIYID